MELEARLGHKVVVRLEGDLDDVGLGGDVAGGLGPAPAAPDDGAGLRDVLHLHIVIPETEQDAQMSLTATTSALPHQFISSPRPCPQHNLLYQMFLSHFVQNDKNTLFVQSTHSK